MELRDYTPDEIEALVNEIELGAMRRDTGVDPSIPQYDAPREVPSLRNDQSILGDYINSLESQALERQKHLKSDGRSPMRRFGEYVVYGAPEYDGAEETMTDSLALAPVRMAYQGAVSAKEGVEEGKPLKALGGTGMMAASVLPLSGPLASKLFSSIPRGFASGAAISASPMLAEEALNASPAYAEGEIGLGEETVNKLRKHGGPILSGVLGGGLSAGLAKSGLLERVANFKQKAVDMERVLQNRERAKIAIDDYPIPNHRTKIEHGLRDKEPIKYHNLDNNQLRNSKVNLDEVADGDLSDINKLGTIAGAPAAVASYYALEDEPALAGALGAGLTGAVVGNKMPSLSRRKISDIKPKVERYDPVPDKKPFVPNGPSDQLRLGRSPISDAHPNNLRRVVEKKLKEGEQVKDLSGEYGLAPSTLYRWRRKLNKSPKVKKIDKKDNPTDTEE
ncbi:MAG: transposase [Rhizobiales bacterium]|nr:transposase [Hyphomicrobiales bacterium]